MALQFMRKGEVEEGGRRGREKSEGEEGGGGRTHNIDAGLTKTSVLFVKISTLQF